MDINILKKYIKDLEGKDQSEVIEALKASPLSQAERNLVFIYFFPRPLLDRELPSRVINARKKAGNERGWIEINEGEVSLLVEAYKTSQYGRFMRHLLHSFLDPSMIHPVSGTERGQCPICGKTIYHYDFWKDHANEDVDKEYLAFGSNESGMELCLDCLIQLQGLDEILKELEGVNYLNAGKFSPNP